MIILAGLQPLSCEQHKSNFCQYCQKKIQSYSTNKHSVARECFPHSEALTYQFHDFAAPGSEGLKTGKIHQFFKLALQIHSLTTSCKFLANREN
jgi:hypothetical protein